MAPRSRYCQRCSEEQVLKDEEAQPNPCKKCGGSNFAIVPVPHSKSLSFWWGGDFESDSDFLRAQGIKPEL